VFHLTLAIARFFEILLLDIAKSALGLIALAVLGLGGAIAGIIGIRRFGPGSARRRK
jgi:hypothetical protein